MNAHETLIRNECRRRKIAIYQHGKAWRFVGKGIDLLAANFECVALDNLTPVRNPDSLKLKLGSRT